MQVRTAVEDHNPESVKRPTHEIIFVRYEKGLEI